MTARKRKPFYERLKQGLEESIAHAKGELTLKTVELPDSPPEIDARTVAALRTAAGMSQAVFAKVLNVSTKSLQSWEQGIRRPSDASRRLLELFSRRPDVVCQLVGLPPIRLPHVRVEELGKGRRRIVITKIA